MLKINLRGRIYYLLGFFVVLFFISALMVTLNTDWSRKALDDIIYDSRYHNLPCGKLPVPAEVERVISERQVTVQKIQQVNPGFVMVLIDTHTCPGRADIVILFASRNDRLEIEKIINGDTFFGIPYSLRNV